MLVSLKKKSSVSNGQPVSPHTTKQSPYSLQSSIMIHCFTNLHEESRDECFPDVDVVLSAAEVRAGSLEVEAIHDARQLLPHVVGRFEGAVVAEVVVAPLRVLVICTSNTEKHYDTMIK